MSRLKTHFEQVPLAIAKRVAEMEVKDQRLMDKVRAIMEVTHADLINIRTDNRKDGTSMTHMVDIFQCESSGNVLWLGSAATVEEAEARVHALGETSSGDYVLLNQKTGNRLVVKLGCV